MKAISFMLWVSSVFLATTLFAETVQLPATKDNTLYFSSTGSLSNGQGSFLFAGDNGNGLERRAVMAFDISGNIPAGATINSATLSLTMSRTTSGAQTITLHRLLADWGEGASNASQQEGGGDSAETGDATWIHRFSPDTLWSSSGGDFSGTESASTSVNGTGAYTWGTSTGMVSDVQTWLDTPSENFGWILVGPGTTSSAKRFNSRENQNGPMLTIDYTAETPTPTHTDLSGTVIFNGTPVTALVLANGKFMFTSGSQAGLEKGEFQLQNVPFDANGEITLFSFVSGLAPFKVVLTEGVTDYEIQMQTDVSGQAAIVVLDTLTDSTTRAGWIDIGGTVENESGTPLCAMALANGQRMFTCGASLGRFDLTVPLDSNDQITLFIFVSGFAPHRETIDKADVLFQFATDF